LQRNFPLSAIDIPTVIFSETVGFDIRPTVAWGTLADQAVLYGGILGLLMGYQTNALSSGT
jgi:hypothetical protein